MPNCCESYIRNESDILQITLGDGLPEQICTECAEQAVQLYLYKLKCEKSDAALRQQLGKSPFIDEFREQTQYFLETDFDTTDESENIVVKPEIHLENEDGASVTSNNEQSNVETYSDTAIPCNNDSLQYETALHCNMCQKVFGNERDLNKHRKTHLPKPFFCETCGKSFTRDDLLLRHKIIHAIKLQEESIKCESYENEDDKIVANDLFHVKDEDDELACRECGAEFGDKGEKLQHMERHKKGETARLQCEICNKRFSKASHLTRHTKIHAAVKPYSCQLCNKGFARAEQLMNHMNAHSGIKPHVCKICSKGKRK